MLGEEKVLLVSRFTISLRCMGSLTCSPAIFSKWDNFSEFLFAFMNDEILPKRTLLFTCKSICSLSRGAYFLPLRVDPIAEEGKIENGGFASPGYVFIH